MTAYQENPGMHLEVFVHKADVLSEEYKIGELQFGLVVTPFSSRFRKLPAYTTESHGRAH